MEVLEQVALLTLLCTIFASILPGIDATGLQITVGVAAIALVYLANALLGFAARSAERAA